MIATFLEPASTGLHLHQLASIQLSPIAFYHNKTKKWEMMTRLVIDAS